MWYVHAALSVLDVTSGPGGTRGDGNSPLAGRERRHGPGPESEGLRDGRFVRHGVARRVPIRKLSVWEQPGCLSRLGVGRTGGSPKARKSTILITCCWNSASPYSVRIPYSSNIVSVSWSACIARGGRGGPAADDDWLGQFRFWVGVGSGPAGACLPSTPVSSETGTKVTPLIFESTSTDREA
jgi:hypothetical protein